jgi:hypothetical protein
MKTSELGFGLCLLIVGAAIAAVVVFWMNTGMVGGETRGGRVRMDVMTLDRAANAYKIKYGNWPAKLEIMAERQADGSPACIVEHHLVDPWGQPYHYDRDQLHPETGKPLIWSDGREPGESGSKISNWDEPMTESALLKYGTGAAVICLVLAALMWWGWRQKKAALQH